MRIPDPPKPGFGNMTGPGSFFFPRACRLSLTKVSKHRQFAKKKYIPTPIHTSPCLQKKLKRDTHVPYPHLYPCCFRKIKFRGLGMCLIPYSYIPMSLRNLERGTHIPTPKAFKAILKKNVCVYPSLQR
jgi:hypothetical protein